MNISAPVHPKGKARPEIEFGAGPLTIEDILLIADGNAPVRLNQSPVS